jgi:hypothetical protein
MTLRVVTWNCNGALRRKWRHVAALQADVYVIQECEEPSSSLDADYQAWARRHLWVGDSRHKGLGVFVRGRHRLAGVDLQHAPWQLFLPCEVDGWPLLTVWTKASSPDFRYIGQLWQFLQLHPRFLDHPHAMAVGDFNGNAIWDTDKRCWNHSDVVRELAAMGLQSCYHRHFDEAQGMESRPTYFQHRHPTRPYHLDYGFTGSAWRVRDVRIGGSRKWLAHSDHLPIALELERIRARRPSAE